MAINLFSAGAYLAVNDTADADEPRFYRKETVGKYFYNDDTASLVISDVKTIPFANLQIEGVAPANLAALYVAMATLLPAASGGGGGGGDATAANQVTGNNTLAAMNTKLPAQGQALMAASQPVVIASNQSAIPVTVASTTVTSLVPGVTATSLGKAEDAVAASGDTIVPIGVIRIDSPATQVSASGDYAVPLQDADGRLWVNNQFATARDAGHTHYRNTALGLTAGVIKSAAGNVFGFNFVNTSNVDSAYVKFYNATTATAGTGTPFKVIHVPPGATATAATSVTMAPDDSPYAFFSTGITVIATKLIADADATAPTAALYAEVVYK